jgi:predicted RNase H-like nuclease (RuvC/YqgF family)
MAKTIEELEAEIENIKKEMVAEESYNIDKKITVKRRSAKDLSYALGLAQSELNKMSSSRVKFKRGGFDE